MKTKPADKKLPQARVMYAAMPELADIFVVTEDPKHLSSAATPSPLLVLPCQSVATAKGSGQFSICAPETALASELVRCSIAACPESPKPSTRYALPSAGLCEIPIGRPKRSWIFWLTALHLANPFSCFAGGQIGIGSYLYYAKHVTNERLGCGLLVAISPSLVHQAYAKLGLVAPSIQSASDGQITGLSLGLKSSLNSASDSRNKSGSSSADKSGEQRQSIWRQLVEFYGKQWHGLPFIIWVILAGCIGHFLTTAMLSAIWRRKK